jgi:hypothetical protein
VPIFAYRSPCSGGSLELCWGVTPEIEVHFDNEILGTFGLAQLGGPTRMSFSCPEGP